jgi:hypothetical protein
MSYPPQQPQDPYTPAPYSPGPYGQPPPQPPVNPAPQQWQQPYPPQQSAPGWPPPQPPAPKKRGPLPWILGIVGGVVGLCVIVGVISAVNGGPDSGSTPQAVDVPGQDAVTGAPAEKAPAGKAKTTPAKKSAGVGSKVRDGKFEFVVTGMDCSKSKVGNEYLNTTAQGKFCVISVTVKNIGDEPRTFTGANQKAYAGKTEFTNDSEAEIYVNSDAQTFLEDVNPGNSVKGKLVFDVPKSTKLTEIELHDGFLSGGARVSL